HAIASGIAQGIDASGDGTGWQDGESSIMPARERLRQLIDAEQERLRQTVPPVHLAVPALLRERQQVPVPTEPDAITGLRTTHPGWNLALRLCLESLSGATPHSVS